MCYCSCSDIVYSPHYTISVSQLSEVPCSAAVELQGNLSIIVAREVWSLTRARVTVCCTAMSGAGVTERLKWKGYYVFDTLYSYFFR